MDFSSHGWIACSVRSHVTPEVFFGAQVHDQHKQIGQGAQDQMVMEASPGTALVMVKAQVVFDPLKILLNMVTRAAQSQTARFGRLLVKMSQLGVRPEWRLDKA